MPARVSVHRSLRHLMVTRRAWGVALAATLALTAAVSGKESHAFASTSAACPRSQTGCIEVMLTMVNNTRAQHGLAAYTLSWPQTNGIRRCVGSYGHSIAMARSGTIWHTNSGYPRASAPRDICLSFTAAGENVGMGGYGNELTDLQKIHSMMMSEPHDATTCSRTYNHACNILSRAYHRIGIGIFYSNNRTWLTEDFTN